MMMIHERGFVCVDTVTQTHPSKQCSWVFLFLRLLRGLFARDHFRIATIHTIVVVVVFVPQKTSPKCHQWATGGIDRFLVAVGQHRRRGRHSHRRVKHTGKRTPLPRWDTRNNTTLHLIDGECRSSTWFIRVGGVGNFLRTSFAHMLLLLSTNVFLGKRTLPSFTKLKHIERQTVFATYTHIVWGLFRSLCIGCSFVHLHFLRL